MPNLPLYLMFGAAICGAIAAFLMWCAVAAGKDPYDD